MAPCDFTSLAGHKTLVASNDWPQGGRDPVEAEGDGFLISSPGRPVEPVVGAKYLAALRPRAAEAISKTLATLPEVTAVLWAAVNRVVRIVTVLSERSVKTIAAVAEQELRLMDEMVKFSFEFRTADESRLEAFFKAGYVPVLEERRDHNAERDNPLPASPG
jgi:hypothetical protein